MESLYSEAHEPSLKLRFTKLRLQYYREKAIKTFGFCMKHILKDTDISLTNIHDTIQLSSPPWLLKQPVVILDLNKLSKNKTHTLTYQEKLNNIQERFLKHLHIILDGSKSNTGTEGRVVLHKKTLKNATQKRPQYILPKSVQ